MLDSKRIGLMVVAALVALVVAGGAANAYSYEQRAGALQQHWKDAQQAGVPASRVDHLRAQLKQIESQHGGTAPYAVTSMALFQDPLAGLERQTQVIYDQANRDARAQARKALTDLKQEYGPTPFDQAQHDRQLLAARKPLDYQKLARTWTQQDQQLALLKGQLENAAGGLSNGLPADVVRGRDQLQQSTDQLQKAQLWTDPADQTLSATQQYLGGSYQQMLAQHDDLKRLLDASNQAVTQRLGLRQQGDDLVGTIPGLVQYGQGGDYGSRADQAKQALQTAHSDEQLQAAVGSLRTIVSELKQKRQESLQRLAAGTGGCEANVSGKAILISLSQQRLLACDGTSTAYSTPVTTGRPGMETPTGTTTISFKQTPWLMKPEAGCNKGDPCWYQATQVNYVMLFRSGGYYLHDWPPQDGAAFGAGTQYGRFASHGCVHVPGGMMAQLYNWAPTGTTVVVTS